MCLKPFHNYGVTTGWVAVLALVVALLLMAAPVAAAETTLATLTEDISFSRDAVCSYMDSSSSTSQRSVPYLHILIADAGLGRPNSIVLSYSSTKYDPMSGSIPSGYYDVSGSFSGQVYITADTAANKLYLYPGENWNPEKVSGQAHVWVALPAGFSMLSVSTNPTAAYPTSGIAIHPSFDTSKGYKYPTYTVPSCHAEWSCPWANTVTAEQMDGDTHRINVTKGGSASKVEIRGSVNSVFGDVILLQEPSTADASVESNFGPFRIFVKSPSDTYYVIDYSVPGLYYPSISNDYVLSVTPRSAAVGEPVTAELTTPTAATVTYVSWLVDGAMYSSYSLNGTTWYEYDSFSGTFSHAVSESQAKTQSVSFSTLGTHRIACRVYNADLAEQASPSVTVTVAGEYGGDAAAVGYVYDLVTGGTVAGASVTASQVSVGNTVSGTSDSSGYFSIAGLKTGAPVTFTVSATGYDERSIRYTAVPQEATWPTEFYLYPGGAPAGVQLYGQVYSSGSMKGISGATVTLSGGHSATTTSSGYFEFSDLTEGTYTITSSAPGHTSLSESVTIGSSPTQRNIALDENCVLTVSVKNADGSGVIADRTVTVSLSNGQETTTTSGVANFTVDYGSYTVTTATEGFSPTSQYVFCDSGSTFSIVFMTNTTAAETPRQSYVPRQVRFTFLSGSGGVLQGLNVTATGINTTVGSIDWFKSLFGLDISTAESVSQTSMTGLTGSDGSVAFMMMDAVYYKINVTSADLGINMTSHLYPREEEYVFTIFKEPPSAASQITWDFGSSAVDDTHTKLMISYRDRGNRTQSFKFSVYDDDRSPLHSEIVSNDQDVSVSYTVENAPGKVMYWGFEAKVNGTSGEPEVLKADQYIRFEDESAFAFGLPDIVRYWLGFVLLVCVGAMFGSISLKFAGPIIGILTLFLKFIDWLPIGWELAIIVMVLGCLSYVRFAKDERMV